MSYRTHSTIFVAATALLMAAAVLVTGSGIAADPGDDVDRQRAPFVEPIDRDVVKQLLDQGLKGPEVFQRLQEMGYQIPEKAIPPTRSGEPIDISEQGDQPNKGMDADTINTWNAIEQALRADDWDLVRELVKQLPDWRSHPGVERLLGRAPTVFPEPKPGKILSPEEHRAITMEMINQADAHDAATRSLQFQPSDEEVVLGSTEGRQPRPFTDIRPPSAPTGEKAPEAVLTVGDSCTYPTIQAAINAAASGDTLWIQGKVFFESNYIISKNLALWGGLDAACLGLDGSRTVVDASTIGYNDTVMEIEGATASTVVIHIMDFINGSNDANFGGGMEISEAAHEVTLDDVDIYNNVSDYGGGVHMTDGSSLYLTSGSRIGNNFSINGGGIYAVGPTTLVSVDASYVGSSVLGGNGATGSGGGIYLMDALLNVGFTDEWGYIYYNTANTGGGVYAAGASSVNLDYSGSVISDNITVSSGGGVYLTGSSSLWNDSGGIVNNLADWDGGGVFSASTGNLDSDDGGICNAAVCARFNGNEAYSGAWGGAIAVWGATWLDLQATWLQNNSVADLGSAIYSTGAANVTLWSLMVTENDSVGGGGTFTLENTPSMDLHSSTLADNTGNTAGAVIYGDGGDLTSQGLIIWGNDGTAPVGGTNTYAITESIDQFGLVGTNVDPLFFNAAADNYHIRPTSPAVDSATFGHYIDIDAQARPFGFNYDAGADEAYARVGRNGSLCAYPDISSAIAASSAGDIIYISPGTYNERFDANVGLSFTQSNSDCTGAVAGSPINVFINAGDAAATWGGVAMLNAPATFNFNNVTLYNGTATYGGILWTAIDSTVNLTDVWVAFGVSDAYGGGGALINGALNLYGSTVIYGNSVVDPGAGGGVWVNPNGSLNLYNTSVVGDSGSPNFSPTDGGGVFVTGGSGMTMNDDSILWFNQTTGDDGGGAFLTGVGSSLTVNDLALVYENTAFDDGGGAALENGALLTLNNGSAILQNHAGSGGGYGAGGGVYVQNTPTNPASVNFNSGTTVSGNDGTGGGGVWVQYDAASSTVTLDDALLQANITTGSGGGIFLGAPGSVLMVQNGSNIGSNVSTGGTGGGIYLYDGILDMDDSTIEFNVANLNGGGIYNETGTANISATAAATAVSNNHATTGEGGAIFDASGSSLVLRSLSGYPLSFDSNTAGTDGGGLYLTNGTYLDIWGDVQITNNTAAGNGGGIYQDGGNGVIDEGSGYRPVVGSNEATTGNGGGVYLVNVSNSGLWYFAQAVIHDNSAPAGSGGGIYADASLFGLYNSIVANNTAGGYGAGMAIANASDATIYATQVAPTAAHVGGGHDGPMATACDPSTLPANRYCTEFFNNVATAYGGALFLNGASTLNVSNTAIFANSGSLGSGVYSQHNGDNLSMTNCRVTDNAGSTGVRMYGAGVLTLDSTTIAGNVGPGVDNDDAASVLTFNSNIVWGNTSGVWTAGATVGGNGCNIDQAGVAGIIADPLFTATGRGAYHLDAGSPAVDVCGSGPGADLDNVARPVGAGYDMGAFEASTGSFTGTVQLQPVRASTGGVTISAYLPGTSTLVASSSTGALGNFLLNVPSGMYDVVADINLYLSAMYANASVGAGGTFNLPIVTLRGGDTDDNGTVGVVDVTYVASRFGSAVEPLADINASGTVDIVDVSATASNYGTSEPTPWP